VLGVVTRPFRWPEAIWAVGGALLLLAVGSIGFADAWSGLARGFDVYLFLIGMMMLSELARQQGLFDWLASVTTSHDRGSPRRLFVLIYVVGIVTTVFLRCGRRRVDAGSIRGLPGRKGQRPFALSSDLRLHRQRSQFRPANLQSGKSRHLQQQHHAATHTLAADTLVGAEPVVLGAGAR
jgi:hypothetical protein